MKKRRPSRNSRHFSEMVKERTNEAAGLFLIGLAVFLTVCVLFPLHAGDVGRTLARYTTRWVGIGGGLVIPVLVAAAGVGAFRQGTPSDPIRRIVGVLIGLFSFCALLGLLSLSFSVTNAGGQCGLWLSDRLRLRVGAPGSYIAVLLGLAGSGFLAADLSIAGLGYWLKLQYKWWDERLRTVDQHPVRSPSAPAVARPQPARAVAEPPAPPVALPRIVTQKPTEKAAAAPHPGPLPRGEKAPKGEPHRVTVSATYTAPPISLLDPPDTAESQKSRLLDALKENAGLLEKTLQDFQVSARVIQITPGPVVTMYELQPTPGTKVQRFTALQDDLAMALRAKSIRILAPIPGKAAVGVEIPNPQTTVVRIRELIDSKLFQASPSPLTIALGKTASGEPFITRLDSMPHLLIAGATGSGKSVCIHTILMSLVYKASPSEMKLILIDPKMLELPAYNDLPHLARPVVTRAKEASAVLKGVVRIMEERYTQFARRKVRSIDDYNALMTKEGAPREPYLVTVIDELADLMMIASRDVEDSVQRLAQMARAVGIHLILATQRPSVDILTGVIKANLPSRIAFQVLSQTDSRVILDQKGAEDLLGRGDLLFLHSAAPQPVRLQCAYVSSGEVERVTAHLRVPGAGTPQDPRLSVSASAGEGEKASPEDEETFRRAVRLTLERRKASYDLLRGNGFSGPKASNLLSLMEMRGLIRKPDGAHRWEINSEAIETYLRTPPVGSATAAPPPSSST